MTERLDWSRDGRHWPHREASRFVFAGGARWHVQIMGAGPPVLLVHGTGSASHSWRTLAPLLAQRHTVIAPDLPDHGFTGPLPGRHSLPGMSAAITALLEALGYEPAVAVGHSAGAAIVIRMTLDRRIAPKALVSLNGALLPWRGLPALLFAPLARLLAANSVVPRFFARRAADPTVISRLVDSTGSRLEAIDADCYRLLASSPAHVAGALAMMADWDLDGLACDLPKLSTPLLAIYSANDRMVAPAEERRLAALLPHARTLILPSLGHLAHEEDAAACDRQIAQFEATVGA
jgi:magnesium chelatase accessory protein